MKFEIKSGTNKDYYFDCETKALGQRFNLYKSVLIGDEFEERAREELRTRGV